MFSKTIEYALRAIVHLVHAAPESRTTEQIAAATKVSPTYMSKVLQSLRRANIVRSQRGMGGGVSLVRDPGELTVLDVVNAVDPIERITKCPLDLAAHGAQLCPLHRRMDDARATIEETFANTIIGEMLAEPAAPPPACGFPGNRDPRQT
ncbi:MAG: Rrf2 family transcriptional regulator [Planctomycetales bacterium]